MYGLPVRHIRPAGPARNVPAPPRRVASTRLWPAALNAEETEERRRGGFAIPLPSRDGIIVLNKVMDTNTTMIFPGPRLMHEKVDVGTKMWVRNGRAALVAAVHAKPSVLSWSYRTKRNPYRYYLRQVLPVILATGHTEAAARHTEDTESRCPYISNTSVCSVTAVGRSVCSVTYAPPHTHSSFSSSLLLHPPLLNPPLLRVSVPPFPPR